MVKVTAIKPLNERPTAAALLDEIAVAAEEIRVVLRARPCDARRIADLSVRIRVGVGELRWVLETTERGERLCLEETRAPDSRVATYCRLPAGRSGPHEG